MNEEWRHIAGYAGRYLVSDYGRIFTMARGGRLMSLVRHRQGCLQVSLTLHRRVRTFQVHRLVAQAFLGPLSPGTKVRHKSGNRADNRVENLELVAGKQGRKPAKEKRPRKDQRGAATAECAGGMSPGCT